MEKIDIEWLKKFKSILSKLGRSSVNYRQCSRCDKEVFTIRVFNKILKNKAFKLKINNIIYYGLFLERTVTVDGTPFYSVCGVRYHLGYSDSEFDISFFGGNAAWVNLSKLHWNDIIEIEYMEITDIKFYEIAALYV